MSYLNETTHYSSISDETQEEHISSQQAEIASINESKSSSLHSIPQSKRTRKHGVRASIAGWFLSFQQSWIPELIGLVMSAICLVAITILLSKVDRKPLPTWSKTVSLNSLVSWLSTFASIGATYSATHGISQMKWVWFTKDKQRLTDMRSFDNASRGALGAFELLFQLGKPRFATLGILAIIMSLGFDPFMQNLVHYYTGPLQVEGVEALAARTFIYDVTGPTYMSGVPDTDPVFKSNIYSSVLQTNRSQPFIAPMFQCPSGNCTWDPFDTLGFCNVCADVTSKLNYTSYTIPDSDYTNFTVSWPGDDDVTIWHDDKPGGLGDNRYMSITQAKRLLEFPQPYGGLKTLQYVVDLKKMQNLINTNLLMNGTKALGMECALNPCVKKINATVKNGVYEEKILDTWSPFRWSDNLTTEGLKAPWDTKLPNGEIPIFGVSLAVERAFQLRNMFDKSFPGFTRDADGRSGVFASNDLISAIFWANFTGSKCPTPDNNVRCIMDGVAEAATKAVRDSTMSVNGTRSPVLVKGKSFITTTYVEVRWVWICLPAAVWILSAITWFGVIWQTRRAALPFWRDNVLPLLYIYRPSSSGAYQEEELVNELEPFDVSIAAYTDKAEGTRVSLMPSNGTLMLMEDMPPISRSSESLHST